MKKVITIEYADNMDCDIQYLHGILYRAYNQAALSIRVMVDITSSTSIHIEREEEFSDTVIVGPLYNLLSKTAKSMGVSVSTLVKELIGDTNG
jgi:hypothetical protein